MIRCGYRGSSEGELFVDEKFEQNMQGAIDAGLDVGVYFFSQSMGAIEAAEEALFVLDLIKDYDISMPVAFDWEPLEDSRAEDINDEELTASALVFCEMIKDAGYTPCVYFYRYIAYHDYDLSRLEDFPFWIGAPGSAPDFYYEAAIWQFSFTSRIDGIDADVDMNLQFYAPGADPACPGARPALADRRTRREPEPTESPEPARHGEKFFGSVVFVDKARRPLYNDLPTTEKPYQEWRRDRPCEARQPAYARCQIRRCKSEDEDERSEFKPAGNRRAFLSGGAIC